jgi:hypothetical protein
MMVGSMRGIMAVQALATQQGASTCPATLVIVFPGLVVVALGSLTPPGATRCVIDIA